MNPYTVIVTREDGAWLADVPAVPGAHTFARSLEGLARAVREVIVLMDDHPDDHDVRVVFDYRVDDELLLEAAQLGRERSVLAARDVELQHHTAKVAEQLSGHGYSVRDTARLLEMTPGRVSQLVNRASKA